MDWLDQLKPASFRGVPFKTDSLKFVVGDDILVREYPFRELPTWQRTGGATDDIHVPAYVIGDDYMEQRDALAQVLSGEGELVHPTRNRLQVVVKGKVTISENPVREGGIARFDITFVRAEKIRYPKAEPNTRLALRDKTQAAQAASMADFAASFSVEDQPGWVQQDSQNWLEKSNDFIEGGLGRFNKAVSAGKSWVGENLSDPLALAENLYSVYTSPADFQDNISNYYSAVKSMFEPLLNDAYSDFNGQQESGVATPSRQQARANNQATVQLTETLATLRAAEAISYREFDNQAEAQQTSRELDAQFRALLLQPHNQQAFIALMDVHAATLADIAARSVNALSLTEYTPKVSEPLVLISYKLYGTTQYAEEIAAHNTHIMHPLLVPAGQPLVVTNRQEVER